MASGRHISITVIYGKTPAWNFSIARKDHYNELSMLFNNGQPYIFSVNDTDNHADIRFVANKKDGFFNIIEGMRVYAKGEAAADQSFNVKYSRTAELKKGVSKFNHSCE